MRVGQTEQALGQIEREYIRRAHDAMIGKSLINQGFAFLFDFFQSKLDDFRSPPAVPGRRNEEHFQGEKDIGEQASRLGLVQKQSEKSQGHAAATSGKKEAPSLVCCQTKVFKTMKSNA